MPVNYSQYIVDPWKGAREADRINMQRNILSQRQKEAEQRNLLADREFGYRQQQDTIANRQRNEANMLAKRQVDMSEQEKRLKMIGIQAKIYRDIFKNANDDQSFQNGVSILKGLGTDPNGNPTPIASDPFYQTVIGRLPESYDPKANEEAVKMFDSLVEQAEGGSETKEIQNYKFAQQDPQFKAFLEKGRGSKSDTRSTMRKEVDDLAEIYGVNKQEAHKMWVNQKSLPERIRLFNNEVEGLRDSMDFKELELSDPTKAQQKIQELRDSYGITELQKKPEPEKEPGKPKPDKEPPKELTREIAIEYIRKANGDRKKAKQLAKQDGYEF